jgi:molecular chaperone HtpG
MLTEHTRPKNGDPGDTETVSEDETFNSQIPLWKKPRAKSSRGIQRVHKSKFHDYDDPLLTIHFSGEGVVSYDALLFIRKRAV